MRRLWISIVVASAGGGLAHAETIVPVESVEKIGEICGALQRPLERQADAKDALAQAQRRALMNTRFRLDVPWGGFTVAEWVEEEKAIHLATGKPFRTFDHRLALFDVGWDDIELEAVEGQIEALKVALAKGMLTLTLLFKLAEEEGTPCVRSQATPYALSIDLLGAELHSGGKVLARGTRNGLDPIPAGQGDTAAAPAKEGESH